MDLARPREQIELNFAGVVLVPTDSGYPPEPPGQAEVQGWLHSPLEFGVVVGGGWRASSVRDQIEITALSSRVEVKDLSGRQDFSRLAQSTARALGTMKSSCRAYGINFQIPLPLKTEEPPGLFVAHRFLDFKRLNDIAPVESATVEIRVRLDDASMGLEFRPLKQAEGPADVVLTANVHRDGDIQARAGGGALEAALLELIRESLKQVLNLVERL